MKETLKRQVFFLLFVVTAVSGCRDPFSPDIEAQYKNLLIVEGFINTGGETTIQLSRTGDLKDWKPVIPEENAEVTVEGDKGTHISGTSGADGRCVLATFSLNASERYRLRIVTGGKTYQTDYLESKRSPEIDNLSFRIENKGFQIFVNTHDEAGRTRYYNWDYTETWEVRSAFPSAFEYKNGQVVHRDPSINLEYCWAGSRSSAILLGSSERLSEDRVTMAPVNYVPGNSPKVVHMYSILVRQYGLTSAAYQYLENVKKNTEQIGTIFDAQPSELKGNVVCVSDPNEQVIGWISAGTVSQKRLFISYEDKPKSGTISDWMYIQRCEPFTSSEDSLLYYLAAGNLIISENRRPMGNGVVLINYTMATGSCTDCRLRGSNIKPDFWPN